MGRAVESVLAGLRGSSAALASQHLMLAALRLSVVKIGRQGVNVGPCELYHARLLYDARLLEWRAQRVQR